MGNTAIVISHFARSMASHSGYGPFGEVIRSTGPMAKVNPFRFSTKYQDDESDMVNFSARKYISSLGEWINRDPKGEAASAHLYCYVQNDPLDNFDSLGTVSSGFDAAMGVSMPATPMPSIPPPLGVPVAIRCEKPYYDNGSCGKNADKAHYSVTGGDGWVIQHFTFSWKLYNCDGSMGAPLHPPSTFEWWEAWQVKAGVLYNDNGGEYDWDIFSYPGQGSGFGSIYCTGHVAFVDDPS